MLGQNRGEDDDRSPLLITVSVLILFEHTRRMKRVSATEIRLAMESIFRHSGLDV